MLLTYKNILQANRLSDIGQICTVFLIQYALNYTEDKIFKKYNVYVTLFTDTKEDVFYTYSRFSRSTSEVLFLGDFGNIITCIFTTAGIYDCLLLVISN